MNLFVFDACALLAVLAMETGADNIRSLLQKAVNRQAHCLMNKVNFLEVYYKCYKAYGKVNANNFADSIRRTPIMIKDTLDDDVFREAGRLKVEYKMSIADSIAVAETIVRSGTLVTSDHHEIEPVEKSENISVFWFR